MNIQERPVTQAGGSLDPFAANERFAAIFEHVGTGLVQVDEAGRMLRVNQELCSLTGYAASELEGRTIFQDTFAEDASADSEQFRRQVAGEIERYTVEKRIFRKGGGYIWASVTSVAARDAQGKFLYAIRVQHDITDRKSAEQALAGRMEEQAALFAFSERLQHCVTRQQVFEAALDAITRALGCERASVLLFDPDGVMRFVAWRGLSDAYRRAVEGHSPWRRDEVNPQPVYMDDVSGSDLPPALQETLAREGIAAAAFLPVPGDRQLAGKFMTYYGTPHRFTESEIEVALTLARLLGFSLGRIAGEEVSKSAERDARHLAAIVESSDDAIISKDLNGVIQTWNAGAERLFGYRPEEAIGQSITMLIPPERWDEEPGILARIRSGERIHHYETVRQRKDGGLIDISLTVSPMRDRNGRIVGASKIARDITERKEAELKLKENEQRLQQLLAALPAAIYTIDADGRLTYFNPAAVELAGRIPVLGKDKWTITERLYNPDGSVLPIEQTPIVVSMREGKPVRGAEVVAERPDGTRVPFIPFPTPLRNASGEITGAINMLVDISERKAAETQQRLLLNELNHRTKNNMQVLQSLLFRAARNAASDEARRVLDEATSRVSAMAAAQRVLYGRTDATRFAVDEFLHSVCETLRQTLPRGIRVVCEEATGVLSNDAAMPLSLILNELVTNAAKHGVKDPATETIRVGLKAGEGRFELYVEDDGPGFDLDAVRNTSSGLRLVRGLARQLQATFEVTRMPSRARLTSSS
ncbi:MAG: PAS domain S-box protein [Bradyrhizobium sp.]|uniref:PAS domain S-box protein n=1 Tax=Bradyrhizobium sp. TaxID=376 RepID=UPI001D9A33CC|nr:PAS domain S-box protein [Bradyrhizobium sp.]MBV9564417.1 PAS domain S-box protein [Bradyrhizobium sp.]